jgi:hypothetical protein
MGVGGLESPVVIDRPAWVPIGGELQHYGAMRRSTLLD